MKSMPWSWGVEILRVASIEVWEERYALVGAAFRHSPVFKSELESLATWLRIGELLAQAAKQVHMTENSL